jgi:hypothetical protein
MKKFLIASAALFLMAVLYSSCKSHGTCPAYGQVDSNKELPA